MADYGPGSRGKTAPGTPVVALPLVRRAGEVHAVGLSAAAPGAYAEQVVVEESMMLPVPNGLPPELAALTEPMAIGHHAVRRAEVKKGDVAIVIGCGPVGLAVIADLELRGIEPIVAADFSPARRALAVTMGATEVVDPAVEPVVEAWQRVDGTKSLVMFEAVGVPGMIHSAMQAAPRGARVVVVGVCMERDSLTPFFGIVKEVNLQFVLGYDPMEFAGTLRSIAEGEIDVAPLITADVDLDGVPAAFEELANPDRHCKILVRPNP